MIRIPDAIFAQMVAAAKREAPDEACGYLAGHETTAEKFIELTNADHSPEHFTLDPKEQFAALKTARADGMKLFAIWHSHPASPARPSLEDIRLAFDPDIVYVILSLAAEAPYAKAFRIRKGEVTNVELELTD
jgi:proteasome lid subunit RPN8/RPN11